MFTSVSSIDNSGGNININNTIPFQLVSYEQEQSMDGLTVDSHSLSTM